MISYASTKNCPRHPSTLLWKWHWHIILYRVFKYPSKEIFVIGKQGEVIIREAVLVNMVLQKQIIVGDFCGGGDEILASHTHFERICNGNFTNDLSRFPLMFWNRDSNSTSLLASCASNFPSLHSFDNTPSPVRVNNEDVSRRHDTAGTEMFIKKTKLNAFDLNQITSGGAH